MGYRTTKFKIKVENSKTNNYTEFYYHFFRNTLIVSLLLLIISAFILGIPHSSANNSGSDNLAITISSSCTLSSVVNVPHNAEVYNGNYLEGIGKTTITTLYNDGNGYSVYAVGYSNNEEGNNKLINSERPEYSIDTGLNTSGLTSAWAMELNNIPDDPSPTPPTIESDYNNIYGIVPPYWTKVAGRASGTTDMAEGSSFTTTYSVYASSNQHAGTYIGQVKYALFHPYKDENMLTIEDAFALSGKNKINIAGVGEYYAMQDMNPNICNAVRITNEISQTQLVDIRDNKLYWVAKLQDGHCWMTQNLDLDLIQNKTYAHADTDLGWASDNFDANATWTLTTDPNWSNHKATPYSSDPGNKYVYTSDSDADDIIYNSLSDCIVAKHTDCDHYHIGNYYNWNAARANGNDNTSICPAGWRLPNLDSNEYGNLLASYNIIQNDTSTTYLENGFNNMRKAPLYFVRAGGATDGSSTNDIGKSTSYSYNRTTLYAAYMSFSNNAVEPIYNNRYYAILYYGRPIRCIAR